MTINYRTDGAWGSGLGRNLTPVEVDENFYGLDQRVALLESAVVEGVGIEVIYEHAGSLYFTLTNSIIQGPFPIPISNWIARGTWTPDTNYSKDDVTDFNGQIYLILQDHTSPSSFDAGFNLGSGLDCYQLLLENLANELPTGGDTFQSLKKRSNADYDVEWAGDKIDEMTDYVLTSPRSAGDTMQWDGTNWINAPLVFASTIDGQQDFFLLSPRNEGDVLTWNGLNWENLPISMALGDLNDVAYKSGGQQDGDCIVWDGAHWTNGIPALDLVALSDVSTSMSFGTDYGGQVLAWDNGTFKWKNTWIIGALTLQISETDLLAGTTQWLVAPSRLHITKVQAIVQKAVTTGGNINVCNIVSGSPNVLYTLAVANSATVGTKSSVTTTGTVEFTEGATIAVTIDSAFATAGAVNLIIEYQMKL